MAQPLTRRAPTRSHPLYLLSDEPPAEDPERVRLRRGLLLIGLVGMCALIYLCLLVQVSELDVTCYQLQSKCDELRAAIGADLVELGGLGDRALNIDQAERSGLVPPIARDRVAVSADLCPPPRSGSEAAEDDNAADRPLILARAAGR